MKNTSFLKNSLSILITLILFTNCSSDDDDTQVSFDLTGSWKVAYFQVDDTKITKTEENTLLTINNGDITAEFTLDSSTGEGTISGINVTNGYNGVFTIENNNEISFGPITSTLVGQPVWSNFYKINSIETFEVKDGMLFMYYDNNVIAFESN